MTGLNDCPNPNCDADVSQLIPIDKKTGELQWYECKKCHSNCYREIPN